MYGRAGGYVGTDQLALLARAGTAPPTNEVVTTRESLAATEYPDVRYPAASEAQLYESERRFHAGDNAENAAGDRFEPSDEHVQGTAPNTTDESVTDESVPAIDADTTQSWDKQQPAPSPEVGSSEERAEAPDAMTAPADDDWQQGEMRQPDDEADVTSDGDVNVDGRG
jgi:hypothetical protein